MTKVASESIEMAAKGPDAAEAAKAAPAAAYRLSPRRWCVLGALCVFGFCNGIVSVPNRRAAAAAAVQTAETVQAAETAAAAETVETAETGETAQTAKTNRCARRPRTTTTTRS